MTAAPLNITIDRAADWSKVVTITDSGGNPVVLTAAVVGVKQVETATTSGTVSAGGVVAVTFVSALTGTVSRLVTVTTGDTPTVTNAKICQAFNSDPHFSAHFKASYSTGSLLATALAAAANDATVNWSIAGTGTTATGVSAAPTSANTTAGVAQVFGLASFKGQLSVRQGSPSIAEFRFEIISGGDGNQVRVVLPRSQTTNLSHQQKYHFDWFADIGSSRARHIQGTATVRGNSTVFGTTLLPAQASTPIIPPSSSATWGAITGTLSDQTDLQTALSGKETAGAAAAAQAYSIQRANHTGTQAHTTISGLGTLATQSGTFSGAHSGNSSGTNTGDQDLSGLLPKLSTLIVTGIADSGMGSPLTLTLVEQWPLVSGRRSWLGSGATLFHDAGSGEWRLEYSDIDTFYFASIVSESQEPWKLSGWTEEQGSGQPNFSLSPNALQPVPSSSGTLALTQSLDGEPDKLTNGYIRGSTTVDDDVTWNYGANAAEAHRIAIGAGTTGAELFGAATVAAANQILGMVSGTATGTTAAASSTSDVISLSIPSAGIWRIETLTTFFNGATGASTLMTLLFDTNVVVPANQFRIGQTQVNTTISALSILTPSLVANIGATNNAGGAYIQSTAFGLIETTAASTLVLRVTNTVALGTSTVMQASLSATKL